MPPPMPNPAKRMTANPARPVQRYRPGKALAEAESSEEEDGEDGEEQEKQQPPQRRHQTGQKPARRPQAPVQQDESEEEEGFVTEDEDEDGGVAVAQATSGLRDIPTKSRYTSEAIAREEEERSEEEESESDEDASEEESSSEDEPQRKFQRPTFIRRSDRKPEVGKAASATPAPTHGAEPLLRPAVEEEDDVEARRLATTEALIRDRIERDALARAAGKKSWDDDEVVAPEDMVDDTDGLDPEGEYVAWKLRELKRLKRDREAIEEREREIEEMERRRGLTAEEREREDAEYISKQKAEREDGRGQTAYMARYHHKGAFFQGDEAAEILRKRDIMGAKFVDEVDKEKLPEYMKIRDMTKLGKKGRTRHTDLKGQDTGAFGRDVMRWRPGDGKREGGDGMGRVGDERFQPDHDGGGRSGPTGANASVVGERRARRSRSRSTRRERSGDGDSHRPPRRSYSRSRSPPRKRSHSPYRDRDKRRRVEAM